MADARIAGEDSAYVIQLIATISFNVLEAGVNPSPSYHVGQHHIAYASSKPVDPDGLPHTCPGR